MAEREGKSGAEEEMKWHVQMMIESRVVGSNARGMKARADGYIKSACLICLTLPWWGHEERKLAWCHAACFKPFCALLYSLLLCILGYYNKIGMNVIKEKLHLTELNRQGRCYSWLLQ